MTKVAFRLVPAFLFPVLVIGAGCKSCEQTPELPAPVAQEGHLPKVPEVPPTADPTYIPPPACAVVATSSVEEGPAPLEIQFTAEGMCTDAAGEFSWDFGDGTEPTHDQNPTHVYQTPGHYEARVTLLDSENHTSDTDNTPIVILGPGEAPSEAPEEAPEEDSGEVP